MNIAFTAFLIVLLLLPGATFQSLYRTVEGYAISDPTLWHQLPATLAGAASIHSLAILILQPWFDCRVQFDAVVTLLAAPGGQAFDHVIAATTERPFWVLWYFVATTALGARGGGKTEDLRQEVGKCDCDLFDVTECPRHGYRVTESGAAKGLVSGVKGVWEKALDASQQRNAAVNQRNGMHEFAKIKYGSRYDDYRNELTEGQTKEILHDNALALTAAKEQSIVPAKTWTCHNPYSQCKKGVTENEVGHRCWVCDSVEGRI